MSGKAYWHIHHNVLMEVAIEPIESRREFIRSTKPRNEIALRLTLLNSVKGKLPQELVEAGTNYINSWAGHLKARVKCNNASTKTYDKWGKYFLKARIKCDKAWAKYNKTLLRCCLQIVKLHYKECKNCPWDGHTIFPKGARA